MGLFKSLEYQNILIFFQGIINIPYITIGTIGYLGSGLEDHVATNEYHVATNDFGQYAHVPWRAATVPNVLPVTFRRRGRGCKGIPRGNFEKSSLPETNSSPLKMGHSRNLYFQPSIFRTMFNVGLLLFSYLWGFSKA